MTKLSADAGHDYYRPRTPVPAALRAPAQRDGRSCGLYAPGHLIPYQHQGDAVQSACFPTRDTLLDDALVTLLLDDGSVRRWRHHDPERLGRILDLLRGTCLVYPGFHALRVGPYWFNCAVDDDEWVDCRVAAPRAGP